MEIGGKELGEIIPPWVFYVGIGLALACGALMYGYYKKYPERNWYEDFARFRIKVPDDVSSLVADAPASDGEDSAA